MASRRKLKKIIHNISESLIIDALTLSLIEDTDKEAANAIIQETSLMEQDFIQRISHTEPGAVKLFYKKLVEDFVNKSSELAERITKL